MSSFLKLAQLAEETMKYIERLTDNDSSKSLIAIGSAFMKTQRKLWMEATTSLKEIESNFNSLNFFMCN